MKVSIKEFCHEVTGKDHSTATCRNLLKHWQIPMDVVGTGKGSRVYHAVDMAYYIKALRTHLGNGNPPPTSGPRTVLSRLAVIEGKLDSIINRLSTGSKR